MEWCLDVRHCVWWDEILCVCVCVLVYVFVPVCVCVFSIVWMHVSLWNTKCTCKHIMQTYEYVCAWMCACACVYTRCPTCSPATRSTRSWAISFPPWSGSFHGDRPPMRTCTSTSCPGSGRTSTWSCASPPSGKSSGTAPWSSRRWYRAAPWTGSAAGPKTPSWPVL